MAHNVLTGKALQDHENRLRRTGMKDAVVQMPGAALARTLYNPGTNVTTSVYDDGTHDTDEQPTEGSQQYDDLMSAHKDLIEEYEQLKAAYNALVDAHNKVITEQLGGPETSEPKAE